MSNIYVDFSATNDGDGTSPAQAGAPGGVGAFNTLVSKTPTTGDTWWLRRTATTLPLASNFTFANVNTVSYIGWPISTDVQYANRPAAGQSGGAANWDADSTANIPTLASNTTQTVTTNSATTGQEFDRIKFTLGTGGFASFTNSPIFRYCTITSALTAATPSMAIGTTATGTGPQFYSCTLSNTSTGATLTIAVKGYAQFYDCTIKHETSSATSSSVSLACGFFVRTTLSDAVSTGATAWLVFNAANINSISSPILLYDCTISISNTTSGAVGISSTANSASAVFRNMNYTGPSMTLATAGSGGSCSYDFHFSSWTQTAANTAGAWQLGSSAQSAQPEYYNVVASNVTFIVGNTTGDIVFQSNITHHISVLLTNCVFANSSIPIYANGPQGPYPGVWSFDHNGTVGAWKFYGPRGTAASTNAYRTGSAQTFSIQVFQTDSTNPFWVPTDFVLPGLEAQFVSASSGSRTVTLYGAYKTAGYTVAPTQEDIWLEVEYMDNAGTAHRTTVSSKTGGSTALTSDSSVWVNDTGLTSFKIALTFTVGQACRIPIRIHYNKTQAGATAYTLFDPVIVVT